MGVVAAISAVASTGYSIVQGQNQKRQQEKKVPRPKKKPQPPSNKKSKSNEIPDADVFISGDVTIDETAIPKRRMGGMVKKGYGKALRGY